MKVLLVTPYSPLLPHDHAANDIALPLVKALAELTELHVYAPGQQNGALACWKSDDVTYYRGTPVSRRQIARLDVYPYAARESWSRQSTREASALVRHLRPDVFHAEYEQAVEPLLQSEGVLTSITLHDLPGEVAVKRRSDTSTLRFAAQQVERRKSQHLKKAIFGKTDAIFVRSERDKGKVFGSHGIIEIAPVGLNPPEIGWVGDRAHVAAFGGAMWRLENEMTAVHLATNVMPLVRRTIPDAELRIFGSRPTPAVRALDQQAGVSVVGEVADYDDEFRRAGVTFAPAMVDAGLLMKAIRAMAMGCPVVLNDASASPIVGLEHDVHALIGETPGALADATVQLMLDRPRATRLGQAATGLVRDRFNWTRTAETYRLVFDRLLGN